jgi:hypothetical protein
LLLLLLVGRQGRWFWLLGWMLLGRYWFDSIFYLLVDLLPRQLQAQQTQSIASNRVANNININTNKPTTIVGSNLQANANNAVNANNANNAVNTANTLTL